jgi:hypothetical protein
MLGAAMASIGKLFGQPIIARRSFFDRLIQRGTAINASVQRLQLFGQNSSFFRQCVAGHLIFARRCAQREQPFLGIVEFLGIKLDAHQGSVDLHGRIAKRIQ